MKSKGISILLITIIMIFSLTPIVQAANIGENVWYYLGKMGDVNSDKKITSKDYEMILEYVVKSRSFNWWQKSRADVDQNGKVNSSDVQAIKKYLEGNSIEKPDNKVNSVTISGPQNVNVGASITLTATVEPASAQGKKVTWTSGNRLIATVDANGKVTGKAKGEVRITAEVEDQEASYKIKVEEVKKTVTGITISKNPTKLTYNVNENINTSGLKVRVTYSTGDTKEITSGFTISPTKVTTPGSQKITVTYEGKTTTFNVTVRDNKVSLGSKGEVSVTRKTNCPSYLDDKTNKNGYWVVDFVGQPDVKNINMNANSNYKCSGAVALYYANVILGKNPSKSAITSAYVSSSSATTTNFPGGGYEYKKCGSYDEQIKTIYDEILKGNPVPLPVKNSSGQAVYVLAYAIKADAAKNGKVLAKDIAVIDTKTGGYTNLNAYYVYTPGGVETYALATRKQTVQIEGMNLYNSNGSVNENKIKELQNYLTNMVGLRDGAYMYDRFDYLQCPWWAYVRASQYLGRPYPSLYASGNNGAQWYKNNKELGYFSYGKTPQPNSIVVWPKTGSGGSAGHVGYVEAVDTVNKKMYVSHAGGGDSWYGIQKMNYNHLLGGIRNNTPTGFIYLDEPLK